MTMDVRQLLYFAPREESRVLKPYLESTGWQVLTAEDETQAKHIIGERDVNVALVPLCNTSQLSDVGQPWLEDDQLRWIALTPSAAPHDPQMASAIAEYFYDFHTLPVDLTRLEFSLGHADGMARLNRGRTLNQDVYDEYEMVGAGEAMKSLFAAIRKVATVDAPVLITGESGTGKELAARAIHERSIRAAGPFVAVNCGALPPSLIQSELFGHEKGSFTGAHQRKIGFVEKAQGGTLFLDEIGDLPLELQINLLRFLQEQTIDRVGGHEPVRVDARVIAATNVNLEQAVDGKRFREDLYYRLNVLSIKMPPLRERGQDTEILAKFFFHKFAGERRHKINGFSTKALQVINSYDWPGNVRELINRVRRAVVMTERSLIQPADLGLSLCDITSSVVSLEKARDDAEISAIHAALKRTRNNVSRAAQSLGVSRVTLYRLMSKHNISL